MSGKLTIQCPACLEHGRDKKGKHLAIFPHGFNCIIFPKDKTHNRRIIELRPDLGKENALPSSSGPCLAVRPKPASKPVDLLSRIKANFPACVADLWEDSPVRCDEDSDDAKALLRRFPADAVLWIAPNIYQSGEPEHARFFRTREKWEAETFTTPGTRIAPSSFKPGSISRGSESVEEHLYVVIETDEIGEGKRYAGKDEFCSLIRWLREACGWHLAAVVDSGGKSLHAWFRHPGATDMGLLAEHAAALGLDSKYSEPSQPWRLPGMKREKSDTRQQLIYLDKEGSL
jgi:hypothetical protein